MIYVSWQETETRERECRVQWVQPGPGGTELDVRVRMPIVPNETLGDIRTRAILAAVRVAKGFLAAQESMTAEELAGVVGNA